MILRSHLEPLDGSGIDRDEAGGKAWALDRLVEHGFPVPTAFVVCSSAYREFAATPEISAVVAMVRSMPHPGPAEAEAVERRIEAVFLAAPMPVAVEDSIRSVVGPLVARHRVAVRSSATAEDLAGSSFAGQYRTFLGVETIDDVLVAVRRCWASLWFPSARAYRRHSRIDDAGLAMAVIVQRMVDADWSGVMFTRDPQGDVSTVRIEAVRDLGDRLVSGQVTPGDHRVARIGLQVVSSHEPTPPHLEDLARLGLRIERRFGEPQDIEWSISDGEIWILQSRAITVASHVSPLDDGFDTHLLVDDDFSPQGVAEMLPGVIPPLLWTINRPLLEEAFRAMLARQDVAPVEVFRPFVARSRGRVVLNQGALEAAAVAGGDAGIESTGPDPDPGDEAVPSRARLGDVWRIWSGRREIESDVDVLTTAVACLASIEPDPRLLPASRLIAYRRELRDLAARGVLAELAASNAAATAYRSLEAFLQQWLGPETGRFEAQQITSGSLGRVSVGPRRVAAIGELLDRHADVAVRNELASVPPDGLHRVLVGSGPGGVAIAAEIEQVADGFGCVSVYGGATYRERERDLWRLVAAAARRPRVEHGAESVEAMLERAIGAAGRRWRAGRVVTGQIIDVRRRVLQRLAEDAIRFLSRREEAKDALLQLGGLERRVIIEGGRRLVRCGFLGHLDDVELLSDDEFEEMLAGAEPVGKDTLARRAATLARLLEEDPRPDGGVAAPQQTTTLPGDPEAIHGWAASAGSVVGRVRHVRDLADGERLQPGEILVAVTTDPSWTPLFMVAGGIVLEQGGPLSHAAIVARELGLPAVLNVPDVRRLLPEGVEVEVDGTAGVVRLVAVSAAVGP